ncbi:class D beta-lactamase [Aminobacter aganoensis]
MSFAIRHLALGATTLLALLVLMPASSATELVVPRPILECTLIVDAGSGAVLRRDGTCDRRVSPASTFKVPLALMGYDAGILADAHSPRWDYRPEFDAVKRDHKAVDPTIWERDSVLWFSREMTRKLGSKRFAGYVAGFAYGNGDISGNPGKKDGLTHSWLSSSLKISPDEQVGFIRRILERSLPVSTRSIDLTMAVLPPFQAGDWQVKGKTGTGWLTGKSGKIDRSRPLGWFVGWAEKGGRRIVFARLFVNDGKSPVFLGPKVRDSFLASLPELVEPAD